MPEGLRITPASVTHSVVRKPERSIAGVARSAPRASRAQALQMLLMQRVKHFLQETLRARMCRLSKELLRWRSFKFAPSIKTIRSAISRAELHFMRYYNHGDPAVGQRFHLQSTSPIISGSNAEVGSSKLIWG